MHRVTDARVLRGALPFRAAGNLPGAVGGRGARVGDKDERCAQQALDAVIDRLAFAE
jgi:uncharacterized protein GlcG (DUF336 family)